MPSRAAVPLLTALAIATLVPSVMTAELPDLPIRPGVWVHVGCGDGTETRALARHPNTLVLGLDREGTEIDRARAASGTEETQITFTLLRSARMPLIDNVANGVIVSDPAQVGREEISRILCPLGTAWFRENDSWRTMTKPWPDDIDNWTHFLHAADGIPVADDTTVGPPRHMQWHARPLWDRSHDFVHSLQAAVTKDGRIFYFLDKASGAAGRLPGQWVIGARDAFNGTLLWENKLDTAPLGRLQGTLTPVQFHRLLVAGDHALYTISGRNSGVRALDVTTGKTVREFPGTEGAEEIIYAHGCVAVVTGHRNGQRESQLALPENSDSRKRRRMGHFVNEKRLGVFDAATGSVLWTWSPDSGRYYVPTTVAIDNGRLVLQERDELHCFDLRTGDRLWRTNVDTPLLKVLRPNHLCSALGIRDGVVLSINRRITALSLEDGKRLWTDNGGVSIAWPVGLFVSGDRVWRPDFSSAWDLHTGRTVVDRGAGWVNEELWTDGHHHRCQPVKATVNFGISAYRGAEFIDLHGDKHCRNNWARGICQFGLLPSQGLLYVPPHTCGCYPSCKLYGFWALAPAREWQPNAAKIGLRERLKAFEEATEGAPAGPDEWPTYRGNIYRSGEAKHPLPTRLNDRWGTRVGGRLTAPVVAGGLILVADRDSNTLHAVNAESGESAWTFRAGGPIDSPPTIYRGLVLSGAADGYVYCLSAKTGKLIWRFFAAPEDYRTVALNQIESVWPVRGSVLVLNDTAYAVAGRQSYIDGGLYFWGLDPATGTVRSYARIVTRNHRFSDGRELRGKTRVETYGNSVRNWKTHGGSDRSSTFVMRGARSDVLTSDGQYLYMGLTRITTAGEVQYESHSRHLFSTSSLLEENENHRSHYVLGTGDFSLTPTAYPWIANSHYKAGRGKGTAVPVGRLIAFDQNTAWSVMRATTRHPTYTYGRGGGPGGYSGVGGDYYLVSMPNRPFDPDEPPKPDFREPGQGGIEEDPGCILMNLEKVECTGDTIRKTKSVISHWSHPTEYVTWRAEITQPGAYRVGGDFTAAGGGARVAVTIKETGKTSVIDVAKTDSWGADDAVSAFAPNAVSIPKAGDYTLALTPTDPANWHPVNVLAFGLVSGEDEPKTPLGARATTSAELNWTKTDGVIRPRSMILAPNAVVIGGMSSEFPDHDPAMNYAGRGEQAAARLCFYSRQDGSVIAKRELPSAPVWNGMAPAYGKLYVVTVDGRILCLGEKQ